MKIQNNNNKKYYTDYKIIHIFSPVDDNSFIYVYHYKIGFSATFKNMNEVEKWMEGF